MRRKKSNIIFLLASFLAVFIIFIALIIGNKGERNEHKVNLVPVMAAPENLDMGTIIDTSKMAWYDVAKTDVSPTVVPKTDLQLIQRINGFVVKDPISKGEIIDLSHLIDTHGKSALAAIIREGMRAVSVPYSKLANAPSLIAPGDIIDIILPKRASKTSNDYFGETILQNVRVLAVDKSLKKTEELQNRSAPPKSITLEVSAEQAEGLAASIRDGQVVVSMHSVFAKEANPALITRMPPVSSRPPEQQTIDIFRGDQKSQITYQQATTSDNPNSKQGN